MRQNGEPSVEEILQSIKQVIARDSRLETRTSRTERLMREPEPLYADEDEDDVLELQEASQITAAGETDEGPLLHDQARDSMRESLAALAMLSEPGAQPQIVRS
jgi:hypothetical protein